jgi:hypothetical protein
MMEGLPMWESFFVGLEGVVERAEEWVGDRTDWGK